MTMENRTLIGNSSIFRLYFFFLVHQDFSQNVSLPLGSLVIFCVHWLPRVGGKRVINFGAVE